MPRGPNRTIVGESKRCPLLELWTHLLWLRRRNIAVHCHYTHLGTWNVSILDYAFRPEVARNASTQVSYLSLLLYLSSVRYIVSKRRKAAWIGQWNPFLNECANDSWFVAFERMTANLISDTWYWYLIPGTRYQVAGSWCGMVRYAMLVARVSKASNLEHRELISDPSCRMASFWFRHWRLVVLASSSWLGKSKTDHRTH